MEKSATKGSVAKMVANKTTLQKRVEFFITKVLHDSGGALCGLVFFWFVVKYSQWLRLRFQVLMKIGFSPDRNSGIS